jgi:branched-chain amino acid:cation transporter, LIVCS family
MFSMFFGSGNLVFPIALGQITSGQSVWAGLGLFVTAVIVPFLGVLAMILYGGSHRSFFRWLGWGGQLLLGGLIIALIGPFGVLPRCLTISYASVAMYFPAFPLLLFSLLSVALIYWILVRKGKFLDVLGTLLSPPLVICLALIIVMGFVAAPAMGASAIGGAAAFGTGLVSGYQTLDLLAAIFFATSVVGYFKGEEKVLPSALKAGAIGMGLLGLVYVAFVYLGAHYGVLLEGVAPQQLILVIAHKVLGPIGGVVAAAAIGLACLTTAVALASVSARFIAEDVMRGRMGERLALALVLMISVGISLFDFQGIAGFLAPILFWCYPVVIAVTVINIGLKLRPLALSDRIA